MTDQQPTFGTNFDGVQLDPEMLKTKRDIEKDKHDFELQKNQIDLKHSGRFLIKEFAENLLTKLTSSEVLGFLICVSFVFGGVYFHSSNIPKSEMSEYYKTVVPIITAYLGYTFGKGRQ